MPYYFICDYCNTEHPIQPHHFRDPAITCNGCGEDICTSCAHLNEYCDSCFDEFVNRKDDDD